ncbi:MAG: hypothetical protein WD425_09680, partial [Nitrospirales bacterium]
VPAGFSPQPRNVFGGNFRLDPFVLAKGSKTIFAWARPLRGPFAAIPNYNGSGTRYGQTAIAEKSIRDGISAAPKAG